MPSAPLLLGILCLLQQSAAQFVNEVKESSSCNRSVDIAIIGAGPAGAYSAYYLRECNLTVELFEYSDRIGGRLYTTELPTIPDVNIELGATTYIGDKHYRVERLVKEMNLTNSTIEVKNDGIKYFLRGVRLTLEEIKSGKVPFDLSPEEKTNQANLVQFYLGKLTGFNESLVTDDQLMKLRVKDGRPLYKVSVNEALDMVATPEGKEFIKAVCSYDSVFDLDASAAEFFHTIMGENAKQEKLLTVNEGMSAIPKRLVDSFLRTDQRNKLNLNRKLEAIYDTDSAQYLLQLRETISKDGETVKTKFSERVCASRVILAVPQRALLELNWAPLQVGKVWSALNAVKPAKASRVYLSFPKSWWLNNQAVNNAKLITSDVSFNQMLEIKSSNVSEEHVIMASFADMYNSEFLENLNKDGKPIPGSVRGANKVTNSLKQELLSHLAEAIGISRKEIPEPISSVAQFWSTYPFGGGWSVWKTGFHYDEVRKTVQHPSLKDDVYIVGSDYGFSHDNVWMESALASVEEMLEKF